MTSLQARPAYDPTQPPTLGDLGVDRLKLKGGVKAYCQSMDSSTDLLAWWNGAFRPHDRDVLRLKNGYGTAARRLEILPGYTFSGRGEVSHRDPRSGGAEMGLELWLNLTRFAAHQPAPIDLDALAAMDANTALRVMPNIAAEAADACLAEKADNLLVGGRWPDGAGWWQRLLAVYLGHIRSVLREVLAPTPDDVPGATVTPAPLRLAEVEIYFEQQTARSARAEVAALYDRLRAAAYDIQADHGFTRLKAHRHGHALVLKAPLTDDIELCIYAKTEHIVRYELRYSGPLHRLAGLPRAASVEDVVGALMVDAVERFGKVAGELVKVLRDAPVSRADLADLLAEVAIACTGDRERIQRVIASFIIDGGVSQVKESPLVPLGDLQHLGHRGVLEPIRLRHGRVRWVLTPRFAPAVETLVGRLSDVRRLGELQAACH